MFDELNTISTSGLKKICREENIPKYSKLKKQDLVILIKSYRISLMVKEGLEQLNLLN